MIFQLQHLEDDESMTYQMVYFTVNIIAITNKPATRVSLRRTRLSVSDVGISSSLFGVKMTSDLFIMPFTTFSC